MEDCYINDAGTVLGAGGWDAGHGGKFVVRHCHLFNVAILCHGTGLDRSRGGRAQELYNNDYHWTFATTMMGVRSGSLVFHNNTFSGVVPYGIGLQTYRLLTRYPGSPWGAASGDNPWDMNVTEPDGPDLTGILRIFLKRDGSGGTQNSGAELQRLTDTSKHWTTNQWVGYAARKTSTTWMGQIISNTNDTLTLRHNPAVTRIETWNAGEGYRIYKVLRALDQPGCGQGDLITGTRPVNRTTGTPAWPHQALEPCYSWNNIHSPGGEHINFIPATTSAATLLQNRDYFNDTPMPGYMPYPYPHPLTIGIQSTASATPNSPRYHYKKKKKTRRLKRKRERT